MRKKTKITICGAVFLVVGLAGGAVSYMFLREGPKEDHAASVDDPTLQNTLIDRTTQTVDKLIANNNLNEILYITASELNKRDYWVSNFGGDVIAAGQTQLLQGHKIINENESSPYGREIFYESRTYSMFSKVAEERFIAKDTYLMRRGKLQNINSATYEESAIREMRGKRPEEITEEDDLLYFYDRFGQTPDGLSFYVLNDYTIAKSEVRSVSPDSYVLFYDLHVKNEDNSDGTPKTRNAGEIYKREVKAMASNDGFPPFNRASIEITIDKNFKIMKTVCVDSYTVNKPIAVTPLSTLTFEFEYPNSYTQIPHYDQFIKHFGSAGTANSGGEVTEETALNYLAAAGVNLLNKERINLDINLNAGTSNSLPIIASIKLNPESIFDSIFDILIGDLNRGHIALKYAGDGLYLVLNDETIIKTDKSQLVGLISGLIDADSDEVEETAKAVSSLVSTLDRVNRQLDVSSSIDITSINGLEEMFDTAEINKDESTKSLTITLHLRDLLKTDSFKGINGDIVLGINDYDTVPMFTFIKSDDLNLGISGLECFPVKIDFSETKSTAFPIIKEDKVAKVPNLNDVISFIKGMISDKNFKLDLDFNIPYQETFINVNGKAYLKLDENNLPSIQADIILKLNEVSYQLSIAYAIDNRLFITINNETKVLIDVATLPEIIDSLRVDSILNFVKPILAVIPNTNIDLSEFEGIPNISSLLNVLIEKLKPTEMPSFQGILDTVTSLFTSASNGQNNELNLDMNISGYDLNCSLDIYNLKGIKLASDKLNLDLAISTHDEEVVLRTFEESEANYTNSDIQNLMNFINNIVESKKLSLSLDMKYENVPSLGNIAFNGVINLDLSHGLDFDLSGNFAADAFKASFNIVKKGDKVLLNLGTLRLVVPLSELSNVIARVEQFAEINFNLDLEMIGSILDAIGNATSYEEIVAIIGSIATSGINPINNEGALSFNPIALLNQISDFKFSENLLSFNTNSSLGSIVIGTGDSVVVPEINVTPETLGIDNINSLFDQLTILKNYFVEGETFHFAVDVNVVEYLMNELGVFTGESRTICEVKNATLDLQLPKDKTKLSFDDVKIGVNLALVLYDETGKATNHNAQIIYDGTDIYLVYNSKLKGKIGRKEGLLVVKYLAQVLGLNQNELINKLLSLIEGGELNSGVWEGIIGDSKTTQIDINKLLHSISSTSTSIDLGLNIGQFTGNENPIYLHMDFNETDLTGVNINNAYIGKNQVVSLNVNVDNSLFTPIETPTDAADYYNFDSVERLIRGFFNTADLKKYQLKGNIKISGLLNQNLEIGTFNLVLDDYGRPTIEFRSYFGDSRNAGACYQGDFVLWYIPDPLDTNLNRGKLYMNRYFYKKILGSIEDKKNYLNDYRTLDSETFNIYDANGNLIPSADAVSNMVQFLMQPTGAMMGIYDSVIDSINNSSTTTEIKLEEILKGYSDDPTTNTTSIKINGSALNSAIGDISLTLVTALRSYVEGKENANYFTKLQATVKLAGVITATIDAEFVDYDPNFEITPPSNLGFNGWSK